MNSKVFNVQVKLMQYVPPKRRETFRRFTASQYPYSRVVLEKLVVAQLAEKFPAVYATRMFSIVFTEAVISPGPVRFPVQNLPSHLFNSCFNIIISSTFRSSKWNIRFKFFY